MKAFLEFVVAHLVDRPAECAVRVNEVGDTTSYLLDLPRSEVGKVIGKQGHTITAIRNLLTNAALRRSGRISLEIEERPEPGDELPAG